MEILFLLSAVVGSAVVVLQTVLSVFGIEHGGGHDLHLDHDAAHAHAAGFQLLSLRSVAAGLAFFGLAGLISLKVQLPLWIAVSAALAASLLAMLGVAFVLRTLGRLESDGSIRIEGAVGLPATVYLGIPGRNAGMGKITMTLDQRTVEYQATTAGDALPTGTPVTIVDITGSDVLEVVATPLIDQGD